jgi:glucan-binding YG repeat protein
MNKNVKRIVAIALAFGTVSAVAPATNVNLLSTKAYASTTNDTDTLDSLDLQTSSGSTIKLYSDNDYASDNKVASDEVSDGDTYYAKTSSSTINIDTGGPSSKYVKVFKGTSSSTKGKSITSDISLSSGTNTLTVRVYSEAPDSSIRYDDDSYVSEYILKVKYTGSDSSDSSTNNDSYDDIYLSKLSVSDGDISFSKSTSTYDFNVGIDVSEITIKATPEDDTYTVKIDGTTVDDTDKYKNTVSLDKGKNTILVEIEDDSSNYRAYTLNINRTSSTSTTTSTGTTTSTPNTTTVKANQWIQANGVWQYNDSTGNPIKNSWFPDRNYGKTYYLQADGSMATGWLSNNGKWYYLGSDGAMRTGWIIDGSKYYYLYSDGAMAYSTTISGYKLGSDGAWIR